MLLEGSCHCRAVTFTVESHHPYPFNFCYCSICRKTAGSGGYGINLAAEASTLQISGEEHIQMYRAHIPQADGGTRISKMERRFCRLCGSALWAWHPDWPEHLHPHASAIDTPLPVPPERTHLMLGSKASWVEPCLQERDLQFEAYPEESIAAWHQRLDLEME